MDLKRVKELISDFTTKNSLNLFDLKYDKSDCVLTVLLDENFSMEELEEGYKTVTKEEIIDLSKKIKQDVEYLLKGVKE